ncbi:hypothetical protein DPMN_037810 [Dreissena polymorpha]|uniref:Uncharacterized protein n=1 Tax=Dreissena polymorpha TaxID=45954 RepID=A0A9D4ME91_DREPO|nr:hypothetical protein DPMN_037810 [Dreissena polymorpha]
MLTPFNDRYSTTTPPITAVGCCALSTEFCSVGRRGGLLHLCGPNPVLGPEVVVETHMVYFNPLVAKAEWAKPWL